MSGAAGAHIRGLAHEQRSYHEIRLSGGGFYHPGIELRQPTSVDNNLKNIWDSFNKWAR